MWLLLAAVGAWRSARPLLPVLGFTALAVWGVDLITFGLKAAAGRERPFEELTDVEPLLRTSVGGSLPSGHAATSFAGAIVLGALFRAALPWLLLLAAAIAFSRVYVGVHYPSDVLAGALLGTAFGLLVLSVRRLRPPSGAGRRRSGPGPPAG